MVEVRHDPGLRQFTAEVDGRRAVVQYEYGGGVMTITHTGVPEAIAGRGIAAELTRAALQFARDRGWRVRPSCSYAAAFMREHPEYSGLAAS